MLVVFPRQNAVDPERFGAEHGMRFFEPTSVIDHEHIGKVARF
jgi:hypothetical protein